VEVPDSHRDAYKRPDEKRQKQKVDAARFCCVYRLIFICSVSNEKAEGKNDYYKYWQYG
jgi:hypothetical protein